MKTIRKVIILPFLVGVLASCQIFTAKPAPIPLSPKISLSTPTLASSSLPTLTPSPAPTETPAYIAPTPIQLPPTATKLQKPPTPTLPASVTKTTIVMENGLTWTECAVPNRDWAMSREDIDFLEKCGKRPGLASENDKKMSGERVKSPQGWSNFRINIGNDHFETKVADKEACCHYELMKNGTVLLKIKTTFLTYDPNVGFWNIGGKLVWELGGDTPVIIVDGINYNEKYHLQGSYHPYEINGKLIYIARQNEKLHLVYADQRIGPEFNSISMPYCCGMLYLFHSNGQYWFVGRREDIKYLVSIQ